MSQGAIFNIPDSGLPSDVPTKFVTTAGTAIPVSHIINFVGTGGTTISASGNTVTINSSLDAIETLTGTTGGPLTPTANNFNILAGTVAAGTTPVQVNGAVSTLTINLQKSQAITSTNATNIGLSAFNSANFTVDANGFVSLLAAGPFVTSVTGTTNRITSTGGTTPVIDISAAYVGQSSITTLGTITTGTWNGTAIGPTFGGTGQTTYTTGDILYASAANTLSKLPIGSATQVLTVTGGIPSWQPAGGGGSTTLLSVGMTTPLSVAQNAVVNIVYDTVIADTASGYNAGTGVYTIPTTGNYRLSVASNWVSTAGFIDCDVFFKDVAAFVFHGTSTATVTDPARTVMNASIVLPFNAGDTVNVAVFAQTKGATAFTCDGFNNGYLNNFSVELL